MYVFDGLLMLCSYMQVAWGGTTDKQLAFHFSCGNFVKVFPLVDKEPTFIPKLLSIRAECQAETIYRVSGSQHCTQILEQLIVHMCVY